MAGSLFSSAGGIGRSGRCPRACLGTRFRRERSEDAARSRTTGLCGRLPRRGRHVSAAFVLPSGLAGASKLGRNKSSRDRFCIDSISSSLIIQKVLGLKFLVVFKLGVFLCNIVIDEGFIVYIPLRDINSLG